MNFRYGLQDDCRRIYDLICEMEEKALPYDHFSRIWEKQIANPDYISLVCEEDGGVIGVLNLRLEEQLHHAQLVAEIMEMAVKAEYRSSGIGKALIRWAYQIAQEKGCLQIEASSNQLRTNAHRFYLREGMKNYHYKFTHKLQGEDLAENALGR